MIDVKYDPRTRLLDNLVSFFDIAELDNVAKIEIIYSAAIKLPQMGHFSMPGAFN
jgi:hypothetical protein